MIQGKEVKHALWHKLVSSRNRGRPNVITLMFLNLDFYLVDIWMYSNGIPSAIYD